MVGKALFNDVLLGLYVHKQVVILTILSILLEYGRNKLVSL